MYGKEGTSRFVSLRFMSMMLRYVLWIGCHLGFSWVNIILYADDILLLAPSISSLQSFLYICESDLDSIDMIINASKSNCLRIGPCWNCDVTSVKLATRNGASIEWSNGCRYLGIFVTSGATFKCKFDAAKAQFYRSINHGQRGQLRVSRGTVFIGAL